MRKTINRPNIIDLEASGFGYDSYPIEVGVVMTDGRRFSRLIKPFDDWHHWSDSAESAHGISRQVLARHGADPNDVARELNAFLDGATLYSDGWIVDKPWLDKLFYRCGVTMAFSVSPLEALLSESQMSCWDAAISTARRDLSVRRHRASMDALVIQQAYYNSLQLVSNQQCSG